MKGIFKFNTMVLLTDTSRRIDASYIIQFIHFLQSVRILHYTHEYKKKNQYDLCVACIYQGRWIPRRVLKYIPYCSQRHWEYIYEEKICFLANTITPVIRIRFFCLKIFKIFSNIKTNLFRIHLFENMR